MASPAYTDVDRDDDDDHHHLLVALSLVTQHPSHCPSNITHFNIHTSQTATGETWMKVQPFMPHGKSCLR